MRTSILFTFFICSFFSGKILAQTNPYAGTDYPFLFSTQSVKNVKDFRFRQVHSYYAWDGNRWMIQWDSVTKYNSSGQLIETGYAEAYTLPGWQTYTYDSIGQLTVKNYYYSSKYWGTINHYRTYYEYPQPNRAVSTRYYLFGNTADERVEYTFNDQSQPIEVVNKLYSDTAHTFLIRNRYRYEYDGLTGKLVNLFLDGYTAPNFLLSEKNEYTYSGIFIDKITKYKYINGNWNKHSRISYTYQGSEVDTESFSTYNASLGFVPSSMNIYYMGSGQELLSYQCFSRTDTVWRKYAYGTFTYSTALGIDQFSGIAEKSKLNIFPAIASEVVNLQCIAGTAGNYKLRIFNVLGEEKYSTDKGTLPPGNYYDAISVKDWPSGVYIAELSATGTAGKTRITGKFIVKH